jgi:hypothetical protein
MPRHTRVFLGRLGGGRYIRNHNWEIINSESVVHIVASEWGPSKNTFANSSEPRFVGELGIRVENISPHSPPDDPNNGVTFTIVIDWNGDPKPIVLDITVFDEPVELVYTDEARNIQSGK